MAESSTDSAEKFNANNYSVNELLQLLDLPPRIEDVSENDILTVTNSNITKYKGKAINKQLIAPRESAQYMQLALFYREIQVKLVTAAKAAAKMENADRAGTQSARERGQAAQGAHGTWDPVIANANAEASAAIRARSRQEAAEAATQAVKDAWRYGGTA